MAAAVGINAAVGCTAAALMVSLFGTIRLLNDDYGVFSGSSDTRHIVSFELTVYGLASLLFAGLFYAVAALDCNCGAKDLPKGSLSFALSLAHTFGHAITMALTTYAVLAFRHFIVYKDAKRNADEASRMVRAYRHVSNLVGINPDPETAAKLARYMNEACKLARRRSSEYYTPLHFDPPSYLFGPFVVLRVCVMILTMHTLCWVIGG